MNAQDIWSGTDYAWSRHGVPKGHRYVSPGYTTRLRAIRVYKEKDYYSTRMKTYVDGLIVDKDGNCDLEQTPVKARVRDIFMRWDEYEEETARRQRERDKAEAERKSRMLQMEMHDDRLRNRLRTIGMPQPVSIAVNVVTFDRDLLETYLEGIDESLPVQEIPNVQEAFTHELPNPDNDDDYI